MLILAIDLGSTSAKVTKSFATLLDTETGVIERTSVPTTTESLLGLLRTHEPHRVVIEMTRGTGWVVDMLRGHGIREVQVVNPRDPAWCNRTSKTDKKDADLLATLSATGMLRTVHVPERHVREWRELIFHRHTLVRDRTRVKNRIRSLLGHHGIATGQAWTVEGMARLNAQAKPLGDCTADELWRGSLHIDLAHLREITRLLAVITARLDKLIQASAGGCLLMEMDGIGARTAEAVVSSIDDPLRFKNQKDLGGFSGLAPQVSQSGSSLRHGRITKQGPAVMRSMLIEAVWLAIRRPGRIRDIYEGLQRKDPARRNRAVTGTARRLAVILWAKLRDQRRQQPGLTTLPVAA